MMARAVRRLNGRTRLGSIGIAICLSFVAGACGGGSIGTKAGGADQIVLRMADVNCCLNYAPGVVYFVNRVEQLSNGSIRILDVDEVGSFAPDAEEQIVKGVAAGRFDLGFTGARIFDTIGVSSFQALMAPMLIDSYALEQAVITSDIPAEMMKAIRKLDVDGIAILGDGLRKPIARRAPLLGPSDWTGITFQAWRSAVQAQAIRALGATPLENLPDSKAWASGKVQGFEKDIFKYHGNAAERDAPYVTANVNLWPLILALFINPRRFATLNEGQRGILKTAAREAIAHSTGLTEDRDLNAVAGACKAGARFRTASDMDLAAMRSAFEPVYTELEKDAKTKSFINRIQQLKQSITQEQPLRIPAGCTGPAPAATQGLTGSAAGRLNGTYRYTLTLEDQKKADPTYDPSLNPQDHWPQVVTIVLKNGKWNPGTRGGGTYSVDGNHIVFVPPSYPGYNGPVGPLRFTFSVDDRGDLHLAPVEPMDDGDAFVWSSKVWTKISD
jgi:TRAP-type C4-dicarboxylate transport system substrate-binding protein